MQNQKAKKLLSKAEHLFEKIRKFAYGRYDTPIENAEKEISSLKAAFKAAVNSYRHKNGKSNNDYTEDVFYENSINFNEFEDETLPKHLSMKRRNN